MPYIEYQEYQSISKAASSPKSHEFSEDEKQGKAALSESTYKTASSLESSLSNTKKPLSIENGTASSIDDFILLDLVKKIEQIPGLSLIVSIFTISLNIFRAIHLGMFSQEDDANRVVKFLSTAGSIVGTALGIACAIGLISISAPVLLLISAVRSTVENLWSFGKSLYDRLTGEGSSDQKYIKDQFTILSKTEEKIELKKLTPLTERINAQRDRNMAIADKTHGLAIAGTVLLGAALLFTPAAPIGAIILTAAVTYAILDTFGLNPFKWIGKAMDAISNKIRNKPLFTFFRHKTNEEVAEELENIKKKAPAKQAEQQVAEQKTAKTFGDNANRLILREAAQQAKNLQSEPRNKNCPAPNMTPSADKLPPSQSIHSFHQKSPESSTHSAKCGTDKDSNSTFTIRI